MTLRPQTPCCSGWARNVGSVQISQSCSICRNDESMAERNTCKHVYRQIQYSRMKQRIRSQFGAQPKQKVNIFDYKVDGCMRQQGQKKKKTEKGVQRNKFCGKAWLMKFRCVVRQLSLPSPNDSAFSTLTLNPMLLSTKVMLYVSVCVFLLIFMHRGSHTYTHTLAHPHSHTIVAYDQWATLNLMKKFYGTTVDASH